MNTESEQTPNKDGELDCAVNTSQTPSFEWKSDVGFDNKVKTLKIDSSKDTFKRLQCFVHYMIRGKNCTLMSTIVSEEGNQRYYNRFYDWILEYGNYNR